MDFHTLFGLVGGFATRKKGMHFGARVWISIPFLGLDPVLSISVGSSLSSLGLLPIIFLNEK